MDLNKNNEKNLEEFYHEMCRICLQISEQMNHLFSMQFSTDFSDVIVFLRRITELKVNKWWFIKVH